MTLPDFLCIGAMRSGTTWLDRILRSHPHIYLPDRRKEVHFFEQYYDRGIDWYQDFFPAKEASCQYKAVGEITPAYIYFPEVPGRIKEHLPNSRFIIVFRNPVDRAYSHYGFHVKNRAETRSFEDLLSDDSEIFLKGLYGEQLNRYFQLFPVENFLILIYENIVQAPDQAFQQIGHFLNIDAALFDRGLVSQRANPSGQIRFARARAAACNFRDFLRDRDLDWLWNIGKSTGFKKLFETKGKALDPIRPELRSELSARYLSDIMTLEDLTGIDLSVWRS